MIDGETEQLKGRLGLAANAMLLSGPDSPYSGTARCIFGEALTVAPTIRLKTIRGQFPLEKVVSPFYASRPGFSNHFLQRPQLLKDPYLDRWAALVQLLDQLHGAGIPRVLHVAFQAFQVALTRDSLEFAIPEFVRAVECIIGLSRGMGRKEFAQRAMSLATRIHKNWYVGGKGNQARARKLYGLRSDCVHGKVPFEELLSTGATGQDEVARFGYMAEALARECLLWVLKNQQHHHHFKNRKTLEDAWANGHLP